MPGLATSWANRALVYAAIAFSYLTFSYLIFLVSTRLKGLNSLVSGRYLQILRIILVLLLSLVFLTALLRSYDPDELGTVHSAWYVKHGYAPYADFFQVQHPLLWYSAVPVLYLFGETVTALIALRIGMFLLTVGILCVTWLIVRRIESSPEVCLFSLILLASNDMFIAKSIEIRPDVPQTLAALVSVYYLLVYFQKRNWGAIALSGFFASISFLFLQKTVFLLLGYAIVFAVVFVYDRFINNQAVDRRQLAKGYLLFGVCFSIPVIFFVLYLVLNNSFHQYILTNWIVNMKYLSSFSLFHPWRNRYDMVINWFFWLGSLIAVPYMLVTRRKSPMLGILLILILVQWAGLFLVKCPNRQYFMIVIPLMTVVLSSASIRFVNTRNITKLSKLTLLLIIILIPLNAFARGTYLSYPLTKQELAQIDHVLQNSDDTDSVHDMGNSFNLYRKDLHYFWYNQEALKTYDAITPDNPVEYNICGLIKSKKPKFISLPDLQTCRLEGLYSGTEYESLYVVNNSWV